MDINAAKTDFAKKGNPRNDEEQQWLRNERCCFRCQQKGHIKRDCPQKPQYNAAKDNCWKGKPTTPSGIQSAKTTEPQKENDCGELVQKISKLDQDRRDDLFVALLERADF